MKLRWFANDDMPINILSRLPAKTLHRIKYVSKEWLHLISDRSFVKLQIKKSEPLSGFFFQEIFQWANNESMNSVSYIPVGSDNINVWPTFLDFLPENVVLSSLNNGLLCCRSCLPSSNPSIYVCNPLNKQWTSVEWPNYLPQESNVAIVFDPFENPIDASTHFKLVAVCNTEIGEDEYCFSFDVYSSKTGLWARSKERCMCNHNLVKNKGVLVEGGILYWLTDGYQILMYDTQNELSWLVDLPIPSTQFTSVPEMCIGESRGELCYVIVSEDGLQMWVLEDCFAPQWELKIFMPLDELEEENPKVLYGISEKVRSRLCRDELAWMDPLAFKDGKVLFRVSTNVYLYEFDIRRMKKLCDVSTLGPKSMFSPIVLPYSMSLVPIGRE
ncbi:hypothetical protein ABFS82_13G042400 [Erythranthe guttata]